jgi:hypothetical protein
VIGPIKYSKPVFCDFNKDGEFEIYITSLDGKVYGINADGRKVKNFPVKVGSGFLDGGIISTPAIADLNNDDDLELIVSTGILQSENGSLFIISGDGEIITEYFVKDSPVVSSPIVANMDNDNELEVCFITYEGKLIGLNYDGTVVKGLPQTLYGSLFSSTPVIDDIDNDDFGELITLSEDGFLDVYDMNVKHLESRWNMYGGGPSKERTYQTIRELQTFTLKKIITDDEVVIEWNTGDLDVDSWNILYKNDVDDDYDEIVNLSSLYNRFNLEQLRWMESFYIKVVGIDDGDIICQSQDLFVEFEKETDEFLATEINNNYPNPFSESTTIVFTVGNYGKSYKDVDISIYDITGKKIAKILQTSYSSGEYSVIWDGNSDAGERVSSGVYFVQMICGGEVKNHRLILLRDK